MQKANPETLHKLLSAPFGEAASLLMNQKEDGLLRTAAFNLQRVSDTPSQDEFVNGTLLPYVQNNIMLGLPVISEGGRGQTAKVLNDLLCQFEDEKGIPFNSDEKSSAMKFAFLFVCSACLIRDTKSAKDFGISKVGFFKPKWRYTNR